PRSWGTRHLAIQIAQLSGSVADLVHALDLPTSGNGEGLELIDSTPRQGANPVGDPGNIAFGGEEPVRPFGDLLGYAGMPRAHAGQPRSEERRVGEEGRSRGAS